MSLVTTRDCGGAVNPDHAINLKVGIGLFTWTRGAPSRTTRIDCFNRFQPLEVDGRSQAIIPMVG
jgi:hypothetical protein